MKTIIVYSSLTGNTKLVCEKAYEVLQGEKEMIPVEEAKNINWEEIKNIIVGYWVDKGTADAKTRKFLSEIQGKHIYFIGTLGAAPDSFHGNKCIKNVTALCAKDNLFQAGVLVRGKVSDELKKKMDTFPLNMIHKIVPEMKQSIIDAEPHPNEEDFEKVRHFIENSVNPNL